MRQRRACRRKRTMSSSWRRRWCSMASFSRHWRAYRTSRRFCGRQRISQKSKRLLKLFSSLKVAFEPPLTASLLTFPAAWTAISDLPLEKTVRAVRILDAKCFDQRRYIHDKFTKVWNGLIRVDFDQRSVTINKDLPGTSSPYSFGGFY